MRETFERLTDRVVFTDDYEYFDLPTAVLNQHDTLSEVNIADREIVVNEDRLIVKHDSKFKSLEIDEDNKIKLREV